MKHYHETILKFLDTLKVDSIKDVRYVGKCYRDTYCVCGQRIGTGYIFKNIKNKRQCIVGKSCLQYVADYLGWND